jgi:anti-sigma factor RsiW
MHPTEATLNDYVDRTLDRDERAAVARHLESCDACREVVAELAEVTRAAAALDALVPPARVWTQIEKELRGGSRRSFSIAPLTWLAAAAVLVLAVVVGVRYQPDRAVGSEGTDAEAVTAAEAIEAELQLAEEHYQKAIARLEGIAASEGSAFDPNTAATLQKNFAVINQAIDESRQAMRTDPASQQAQYSLIENFKTKLALLQDTVALINELRAGDEAAAARIVSGS